MELTDRLKERFPQLETEQNFPFSRHTTIGCGGCADLAASPSEEECAELLKFLEVERIPYCFLGAGANVLPSEGRFCGVVILFGKMKRIHADKEYLYAGAGVTGGALCRFAAEHGIGGFEPFTGIPMTVGGATVMNAGVAERHVSDLVECVFALDRGDPKVFGWQKCRFAEKSSLFQRGGIAVTGVLFRAARCDRNEIERRTELFRNRRTRLPVGKSMGCVFVNPQGRSAGKIIDECGLKGLSVGGAYVSELHANFIINKNGTADDVARLIDLVKRTVKEKTGIGLREEIRRIPFPSQADT